MRAQDLLAQAKGESSSKTLEFCKDTKQNSKHGSMPVPLRLNVVLIGLASYLWQECLTGKGEDEGT